MKKLAFFIACLLLPLLASCQTVRSYSYGFKMPSLTLGNTPITATGIQLNYNNTLTGNTQTQLNGKQPLLVSGVNIATVGGQNLLLGGNVVLSGTGTLTTLTATNANGLTFSISNPTSTPNITITLGDITPSHVNGISLSGSSTPQLSVTGNASISGSNSGDNAANSLYSSLVTNATHTGDATGSEALVVVAINGVHLSALGTGLLKNTTGTGVPSIATAGVDYLTPTGSAAGLIGFPTFNQATTANAGSATKLATARNLNGVLFDGTADISIPINLTPGAAGNIPMSNGSGAFVVDTPVDYTGYVVMKHPTITPKTSSYSLQVADDGTIITMNTSGATTLTIPLNSSQAIPVGSTISLFNIGSGTMTFTVTGGVTVYYSALNLAQNKGASLTKIATDTWVLVGGLN